MEKLRWAEKEWRELDHEVAEEAASNASQPREESRPLEGNVDLEPSQLEEAGLKRVAERR